MTLDDDDIEAIEAIFSRLLTGARPRAELVDAATLAGLLGVSRDYIYRHRQELGGRKIGAGPKAPIRFEPPAARRAHETTDELTQAPATSARHVRRRADLSAPLLPVRERG